jgi:hypothetical protein
MAIYFPLKTLKGNNNNKNIIYRDEGNFHFTWATILPSGLVRVQDTTLICRFVDVIGTRNFNHKHVQICWKINLLLPTPSI